MTKDPTTWLPFFIGEHLRDSMGMDAVTERAYLHVKIHYWIQQGHVPYDVKMLSMVGRLSGHRRAQQILADVMQHFTVKNGMLHHERLHEELIKAFENQQKNQDRTKKATEARKKKRQRDVERDVNVTSDCDIAHDDNVTDDVADNVPFTPSPSPNKEPIGSYSDTPKIDKSILEVSADPPAASKANKNISSRKKYIFDTGIELLASQDGKHNNHRAFLAKMIKDYGEVMVMEAVEKAVKEEPAEAKSFIAGQLKARATSKPRLSGAYYTELKIKRKNGEFLSTEESQYIADFEAQEQGKVIVPKKPPLSPEQEAGQRYKDLKWQEKMGVWIAPSKLVWMRDYEKKTAMPDNDPGQKKEAK